MYSKAQDIEIAGFFAAIFAWGQRITIINKCTDLFERMDNVPHDFILNHQETDLKKMLGFSHRTFNDTDLLYFISFLHHHYSKHSSLEDSFSKGINSKSESVEQGLINFRNYFFSLPDAPSRTQKHIASPAMGSACKRLNMYLRWMVRSPRKGVDFGLWTKIKPSQLVCPLDVHSGRVARKLGLLARTQDDWTAAMELTTNLKLLDAKDPVKYDFALFGMGVEGEM
ncbi:MAG: TIGR02757 family protein [Bacteroidetes bacterium B1(2017)]|nr:MAG: TIGR02757 family protein [Bacteroidetes bacterium B1(2017)]